jgi:hypothetical protein
MAHHEELHDHDRGLSHDLPTLVSRRRALTLLGGAGLAALSACGFTRSDDSSSAAKSPSTSSAAGSGSASSMASTEQAGTQIPEETAGPYPGDGSNGTNVLTESGIIRPACAAPC